MLFFYITNFFEYFFITTFILSSIDRICTSSYTIYTLNIIKTTKEKRLARREKGLKNAVRNNGKY